MTKRGAGKDAENAPLGILGVATTSLTRVGLDNHEAKFWLHDLPVAVNAGFPVPEIGAIVRHLRSQRTILEGKWHEHFGN
jgi:hypothetical protein